MAPHDITAQHGGAPPAACALTPADLAAQATRWRQLEAQAMTEPTETGYGLRLTFRTQPSVAHELRRLAAVEHQCCPWATWTVETGEPWCAGFVSAVLAGGLSAGG